MCSKTELRDTFHIFDLLLLIFSFFKFFLQNFFGQTAGRLRKRWLQKKIEKAENKEKEVKNMKNVT